MTAEVKIQEIDPGSIGIVRVTTETGSEENRPSGNSGIDWYTCERSASEVFGVSVDTENFDQIVRGKFAELTGRMSPDERRHFALGPAAIVEESGVVRIDPRDKGLWGDIEVAPYSRIALLESKTQADGLIVPNGQVIKRIWG